MNDQKNFPKYFDNLLKTFTKKLEKEKQKQNKVLAEFEESQLKEEKNYQEISQKIKLLEEIIKSIEEQIRSRDEIITIQTKKAKSGEEMLEVYNLYIENIHQEIADHNDQLRE